MARLGGGGTRGVWRLVAVAAVALLLVGVSGAEQGGTQGGKYDDTRTADCIKDCSGFADKTIMCKFALSVKDDACASDCTAGFFRFMQSNCDADGGTNTGGNKPDGTNTGGTSTGGKPDGTNTSGTPGGGGKPDGTNTGAGGKPDGTNTGAGGKPNGTNTGAGGKPDGTNTSDTRTAECIEDCSGFADKTRMCTFALSVKDDACASDCSAGFFRAMQSNCAAGGENEGGDGEDAPECVLDCPGIDAVDASSAKQVCAFLDTVKDDECVSDCANDEINTLSQDYKCTARGELEAAKQERIKEKEAKKQAAETRKAEKQAVVDDKKMRLEAARKMRQSAKANLTANLSTKQKLRAEMAAAALERKAKLMKVKTAVEAADEDAACASLCKSMDLADCTMMYCEAAPASSTRRLLASSWDTTATLNTAEVDTSAVEQSLSTSGLSYTADETEPATELASIPGVDASAVDSLVKQTETVSTEEAAVQTAEAELQTATDEVATAATELTEAENEDVDDGSGARAFLRTAAAALAAAVALLL